MKAIIPFLSALIAALLLCSPTAAQTPIADDPTQMDGFVSWYMRLYMPAEATPTATPAANAVTSVILSVMSWDSPQHAATAFDALVTPLVEAESPLEGPGGFATLEHLDGIGDQAVSMVFEPDPGATPEAPEGMEHEVFPVAMVVVVDGASIFMIEVDNTTDLTSPMEIAGKMIEAGVPDSPVTLHDDGTSTGGPFETMTGAEAATVMQGLVPMADADLSVV